MSAATSDQTNDDPEEIAMHWINGEWVDAHIGIVGDLT